MINLDSVLSFEIITIGGEILDGRVTDTNSQFIGQQLSNKGQKLRFRQSVHDDPEDITKAFNLAQSRSDYVFVTGGLGPTQDDITLDCFARCFHKEMILNQAVLDDITQKLSQRGRSINAQQKKQALSPKGSKTLDNMIGTAPGILNKHEATHWFFLPGIPTELKSIYTNKIFPLIPKNEQYKKTTWVTYLSSEGSLAEELKELHEDCKNSNIDLSFRTHFPENHITLKTFCGNFTEFDKFSGQLETTLKPYNAQKITENTLNPELKLFELLKKNKLHLISCESCTGGYIANQITNTPNSSEHYLGSFICYDNQFKQYIGLTPDLLSQFGAVSEETVLSLGQNSLKQLQATFSDKNLITISISGICGPGGGSKDKPVGTAYLAIHCHDKQNFTLKLQGKKHWSRLQNKHYFYTQALKALINYLS